MKTFSIKVLKALIAMTALAFGLCFSTAAQTLAAQLDDKEIPLSEFSSISVGNNFEVTLVKGNYAIKLTVDKELAPYVETYVKSRTLNLSYDSKSVPKEIKKLYRGRNAMAPVFRAIIFLPQLESISLADNASLTGAELFDADKFSLSIGDKSMVKNLSVNARSAYIGARKNSQAIVDLHVEGPAELAVDGNANVKLNLTAEEFSVSAAGSSQSSITDKCKSLNISSSASSLLSLFSKSEKASVSLEGNSKISLSGEADKMTLKSSRNSKLDALSFQVEEIEASMAGSSDAVISVEKVLDVTLTGGSELLYNGSPEFRIGKIVKSTLAPYGSVR